MTQEEVKKLHGQYIPAAIREQVKENLPPLMHIDTGNVLRYQNGQHPNSKKQLTWAGSRQAVENLLKHRTSANKKTRKPLQETYKALLEQIKEFPDNSRRNKKKKTKLESTKEFFARIQLEAIEESYRTRNFMLLSKLLTDFRLTAGEIPTQEVETKDLRQDQLGDKTVQEKLKEMIDYIHQLEKGRS